MALAEAYDKLAVDLVGAKERLARILSSKDKRATVRTCSMHWQISACFHNSSCMNFDKRVVYFKM